MSRSATQQHAYGYHHCVVHLRMDKMVDFMVCGFLKKKIYFFIWKRAGAEGEGEADSPLNKEPDMGLDPRTLESWPELKADA